MSVPEGFVEIADSAEKAQNDRHHDRIQNRENKDGDENRSGALDVEISGNDENEDERNEQSGVMDQKAQSRVQPTQEKNVVGGGDYEGEEKDQKELRYRQTDRSVYPFTAIDDKGNDRKEKSDDRRKDASSGRNAA